MTEPRAIDVRMTPPGGGEAVSVPIPQMQDRLSRGWAFAEDANVPIYQVQTDDVGQARVRQGMVRGSDYDAVVGENSASRRTLLPTSELAELHAIQQGDERLDAERQQNAGLTAGLGAVDQLTFGGFSAAMRRVGPEDFQEQADRLRAVHPGAHMLGQVGGLVVPLPLGGAGWARGLLGSSGAAIAAGRAARSVVGRVAGRHAAGGMARTAGVGAEAVAEGLVAGGLQALTDASIANDFDNLSERMLADGGYGALFGVGATAGLTVLGRGFRSIRRGADTAAGWTPDGVLAGEHATPGFARQAFGRMQRLVGNVDPTAQSMSAERLAQGFIRVADDPVRFMDGFAHSIDEAWASSRQVFDELADSAAFMRRATVRDAVSQIPRQAAVRAMDRIHDSVASAEGVLAGNSGLPRQAALSSFTERVRTASQNADVASLLSVRDELDTLRRTLPESARSPLSVGVASGLVKGIDDVLLDRNSMGKLSDLLEARADLMGELFSVRHRIGTDFAEGLVGDKFRGSTLMGAGREMAQTGRSGKMDAVRDLVGLGERRGGQMQMLDVTHGNWPGVQQLQGRLDDFHGWVESERLFKQSNQFSGVGAALGVSAGLGAAGFAVGGPVGAFAGALTGAALTRPMMVSVQMERVKQMLGTSNRRLGLAFSGLRASLVASSRASFAKQPEPQGEVARAFLEGSREERRQTYEDVADRVERLLLDPEMLMQQSQVTVEGAADVHPNLPSALGNGLSRGVAALANALPTARRSRRGGMRLPGVELPASQTEIDAFLEAAAVVEDPVFGVEMLAAGQLSRHGARALQEAYPRMHGEVSAAVLQEVATAAQNGTNLNYQTSITLSTLLGVPLDSTLTPDFIMSMQQTFSQTSEQERAVRSQATVQREISGLVASNTSVTSQSLEN